MSLSKLEHFMDQKYQWRCIDLRGEIVVIKGDALCYHLYFRNHIWQCGGNYYEFYNTVTEFFNMLEHLQITPYVVMNGALTAESTYKDRCVERLRHISSIRANSTASVHESVLPLFAKTVFVDAMRKLEVDVIIADGDGDPVCVSLANDLNCPVLGHDADFFIFNINGGYVPLYDTRGNLIDLRERVRCYNFTAFDTQIGMTPDQRLYLPALLKTCGAKVSTREIMALLEEIQSGAHIKRLNDFCGIGPKMYQIRSFYRVQSIAKTYQEIVRSTSFPTLNPNIPQWILTAYKCGGFSQQMMQFLCSKNWRYTNVIEDTRRVSAWSITTKPRRYILGSLSTLLEDGSVISDTVRTGVPCGLRESRIELKEKHCQLFDNLDDMSRKDVTERQKILLKAFNCKHIQVSVHRVPTKLKLAVIACRAWLKENEQCFTPLVTPLVYCMLSCSGLIPMPTKVSTGTTLVDQESLDRLHSLAQWQCMLHHAIAFNQLLCNAFQYTSPAKLFSCSVFEHFYQHPSPHVGELPSVIIEVITKR